MTSSEKVKYFSEKKLNLTLIMYLDDEQSIDQSYKGGLESIDDTADKIYEQFGPVYPVKNSDLKNGMILQRLTKKFHIVLY